MAQTHMRIRTQFQKVLYDSRYTEASHDDALLDQLCQIARPEKKPKDDGVVSVSHTKQITDSYLALLPPGSTVNWSAGESLAAKAIAKVYTVEEFEECYQHYKAQTYWADKRLHLRYLLGQMPEYFSAKAAGRLQPKPSRFIPDRTGKAPEGL